MRLIRDARLWHLLLIAAVSCAYESLFVHHGIGWLYDEGWPLYAAMKLHLGGVLYGDTFFLFPPGHLLPAWIAYALDPPGVILARYIHAGFTVALCAVLYLLARKLMRPHFALLAALLVALAAPRSHLVHLLFGYRYLVFTALTLLAFAARLRTGNRKWMIAAGLWAGLALCFRLTPAFAVCCGIAVGVMSADRDWRSWLRNWGLYALGVLLIVAPVLVWLAGGAGLEAAWRAVVIRVLPLTAMQTQPVPEMLFPTRWDRELIYEWFVPVQYWMYTTMYVGYAAVLARDWYRSFKERHDFEHSLLLAVVIWGGIFFLRTLGRSDEHHLNTALPPACLLLAHLASAAFGTLQSRRGTPQRWQSPAEVLFCTVAFAGWIFLQGSDLYLDRERRGVHPLRCLEGGIFIDSAKDAAKLDAKVETIVRSTEPGDTILDLSHAPMIHLLTDRDGPGYGDVVTPGVFANPVDERAFVERLERAPPALVLWPSHPFDRMPSRSITASAPLLSRWVRAHYEKPDPRRGDYIMFPRKPAGTPHLRFEGTSRSAGGSE
ncbi:glycosyltransferase family 39 protein [bacterium]|nr:glycosyltransferase family 39 protein [bacterium]